MDSGGIRTRCILDANVTNDLLLIYAYVHRIPLFIDGNKLEVGLAFALAEVPNLPSRLDIFRNFEMNFRKEEDFCFGD
jgi:hypothetical protein